MSKLNKYGFIFIAPGHSKPKVEKINYELFSSTICAVSSVDDACEIARTMVENGTQVIELCGGFDDLGLNKITDATQNKIPVGLVKFNDNELKKLKLFLGE